MKRGVHHLIAAGCVVLVGALLCGLHRFVRRDLAAVLGVLLLWLAGAGGAGWYVIGGLKVIYDGLDKLEPIAAGLKALSWPWAVAFWIGPGLWIGLVARSPLLISAALLCLYVLIGWLNDTIPSNPRVVIRPGSRIAYLRQGINTAGPWLTGTVVGLILRAVLHW
jgi:hypothetical protein